MKKREDLDYDKLNFPANGRANMYALRYAVKLMEPQPALFIRSSKTTSQKPLKMDIYDALHRSVILLNYIREMSKATFTTTKIKAKPPAIGAFAVQGSDLGTSVSALGTLSAATNVQSSNLAAYYTCGMSSTI